MRQDPGNEKTFDLLKFCGGFVLLALFFCAAAGMLPTALLDPACRLTAQAASYLLGLFGTRSVVAGTIIVAGRFRADIIPECTSLFMTVLFCAFVLASPATIGKKALGLLCGVPALTMLNLARIAITVATGAHFPFLFEYVHVYLGQVAMIFSVFAVCMVWLCTVTAVPLPGTITRFFIRFAAWSCLPFLCWLYLNKWYVLIGDFPVRALFALSGHTLEIDYKQEVYYQTFNLIGFVALMLASKSCAPSGKTKGTLTGILILFTTHELIRICNVLLKCYHVESADRFSLLLNVSGNYLMPVVIWLTVYYGKKVPPPPSGAGRQGPVPGSAIRRIMTVFVVILGLIAFRTNISAGTVNAPTAGTFQKAPATVLDRLAAGKPQDLIVLFDDSAVEAQATRRKRRAGIEHDDAALLAFKAGRYRELKSAATASLLPGDGETIREFSHLPMAFRRVRSIAALGRLLDRPEVIAVFENRPIYPVLAQSLPLINQPAVAAMGLIGSGTAVAVIDTGINYTLADFGSCSSPGIPAACRVVASVDITGNGVTLNTAPNNHGTNVSGIVAGVAPGTNIAAVNAFSGGGSTTAWVIDGINWAIANKTAYSIAAINMSLGDGVDYTSPCSNRHVNPFVTPINNARSAGLIPVAAAGNSGYTDGISSPACTPGVVSVGAVYDSNVGGLTWSTGGSATCTDSTTTADQITCFSNSADFLTMLAPGALITAAGITMGGTSQASPHVAGSVAVLRSAFPADTLDQTVARMVNNGVTITDPRNGVTKPRLDLLAALGLTPQADLAVAMAQDPASPTAGGNLTWSVTVTNNGPSAATGVTLSDPLPDGVDFVSASAGCSLSAGTVTCTLGALANGASATVQIVVTPTRAGNLSNSVTVSSADQDPVSANNSATFTTSVAAAATPAVPALSPWGIIGTAALLLTGVVGLAKGNRSRDGQKDNL